ncbi:spidroin-1-like [Prionailurus viverrinus]|uniref:spidroin-1-like n=1 Tax=Prionailurus viverrinus TaxID=61388 RepID=UPI001FF2F4B4|nr:spidroin-1-like [Prionailurus viverrinus]
MAGAGSTGRAAATRAERRAIDARGARFLFRPACGEGAAEGGVGRGKRGSLRAPPGRRRGPGRRRSSGGRAGGGSGWRAAVGGGAGPAEQGGLGGALAGRGGGTAGPTRRPASGLSPQSPARNRRLGPGPARSGLPCRTLFGSTRTSFGKSSAPRGRLHSCTFIYCHLLQHLVPGRRERREEVEDMNGKRIHLLYVKSLKQVLFLADSSLSNEDDLPCQTSSES